MRIRNLITATALLAAFGILSLAVLSTIAAPSAPDTAERDALRNRVAQLERELAERTVSQHRSDRRARDLSRRLEDRERAAVARAPVPDEPATAVEQAAAPIESSVVTTPFDETTAGDAARALNAEQQSRQAWIDVSSIHAAETSSSTIRIIPHLTLAFDGSAQRESAFGRARRELDLDDGSERELRRIVAGRDAAYRNAVSAVVEEIGGRAAVVERPNTYDLDRADEVFEASVRGLLTDTQRERWEKRQMSGWFSQSRPKETTAATTTSPVWLRP